MSDPQRQFRQGTSLLSAAPRPHGQDEPALADALARHSLARSRRERAPSPLLAPPHVEDKPAQTAEDTAPPPPLRAEEPSPALAERRPAEGLRASMSRLFGRQGTTAPEADWSDAGRDETAGARVDAAPPLPVAAVRTAGARTVLATTAAGALIGAAVAIGWPASYVATAELLIDPRDGAGPAIAGQLTTDAAIALVDNQLRVLKSGTMLAAAADRLNLQADPEFNGASSGLFGLGGVLAGVGDLVSGDDAAGAARRRAVDALSRAVDARRVGGSTSVMLTASSSDPAKSALVANTIAEMFAANAGNAPAGIASGAARLETLRADLEAAERAVETFKTQNELVDAQGRLITDDEILRVGELLTAARARTAELNARAASTREADVDSIVTGSLPEQFASPALADLRARYADIRRDADRMSVKLGPRHPERLAAEAELEGARQGIGAELRRVAGAVQTELRRAVQQEQELAAQLARMKVRQGDIGEEMIRLRELERTAEARRAAYEDALRTAQAGAPATGGVSIISRAEPPLGATGPSLAGFSTAGAAAGLLAGLALRRRRVATDETEDQTGISTPQGGKEQDAMNPYPYQAGPAYAAADPSQQTAQQAPQQPAYAPHPAMPPAQQAWQPAPPAHVWPQQPVQAAPAPHPQMAMQPQAPVYPGWPAMQQPAWPPQQMHQPMPVMQPPHDPWAHLRAYAPPAPPAYPPQAYGQPTFVPVAILQQPGYPVAQPAPAQAYRQPAPVRDEPGHGLTRERRREARPRHHEERDADHQAFVDDRTDEAIEEIRQSLRAFREAIEDIADDRDHRRRYGT